MRTVNDATMSSCLSSSACSVARVSSSSSRSMIVRCILLKSASCSFSLASICLEESRTLDPDSPSNVESRFSIRVIDAFATPLLRRSFDMSCVSVILLDRIVRIMYRVRGTITRRVRGTITRTWPGGRMCRDGDEQVVESSRGLASKLRLESNTVLYLKSGSKDQ